MKTALNTIENSILKVEAASNGTIAMTDKRTGKRYENLLTFEECADIGDGWFHGIAVNDRRILSSASPSEISIVTDGPEKATIGIKTILDVPERFDFTTMLRTTGTTPITIYSEITLRKNCDRIEVETSIDNTARDHRIRVFFPTNLKGDTYISDSAFNFVERPVALVKDNATRFELDVENRPQATWTAFTDGKNGLAVISR